MPKPFEPQFTNVHKDIERYLTALGKREKTPDGFVKFTGYSDAQAHIVGLYFDAGAYAPLVDYFRNWNWEWSYNTDLTRLTEMLTARRCWSLLKRLWNGVLSKRRSHYNAVWRVIRRAPDALPAETIERAQSLLVETLGDLGALADQFGDQNDRDVYARMRRRVDQGGKA